MVYRIHVGGALEVTVSGQQREHICGHWYTFVRATSIVGKAHMGNVPMSAKLEQLIMCVDLGK